jgi:hypothetical protein
LQINGYAVARHLPRPTGFIALLAAATVAAMAAIALLAAPARADEAAALPNGGIHSLTQDEGRIRELLTRAGWVSPGLSKSRWLYMVSFRSCPDCVRFETEQFPDIHKAGIDTRVIMVARRNRSTAPERSGVAELWAHREWKTFQTWTGMPVEAWTAEGLPSADTDPERAAQLERSRALVDELVPLLAANGIRFAYPTLIWQGPDGHLRGCACEERMTYPYIRKELGLPNS